MGVGLRTVEWLARARLLVQLGRPLFLIAGILFHGLGVALALSQGARLDPAALIVGQVAITAIQLMTHYCNDYYDLAADRANRTPTRWSGGSRVLVEERLPPRVALITALSLALIALAASAALAVAIRPGLGTFALLLLELALAWSYTGPPLNLHTRGIGEAVAAFLIPGLTALVGFYLQTGQITTLPFLTTAPLWGLQFGMILNVDYPDAEGDRRAGKRTLVVRLGPARAARLNILVLLAVYLMLPLLTLLGLPPGVALASGLTLPLALWHSWRLHRGAATDPRRWSSLAFWGIALLVFTALAQLLALLALTPDLMGKLSALFRS